jgi:hypothetical protein
MLASSYMQKLRTIIKNLQGVLVQLKEMSYIVFRKNKNEKTSSI